MTRAAAPSRSVARRFGLTDDDLAVLNPYTLASFPGTTAPPPVGLSCQICACSLREETDEGGARRGLLRPNR